jgi:hypothetical protein
MDDFEFDTDLLISLVEARPVLWARRMMFIKTNETKKARREVCVCLQKDFEALEDVQKRFCWVLSKFIEHS